jgi:hypothetical protein
MKMTQYTNDKNMLAYIALEERYISWIYLPAAFEVKKVSKASFQFS